MDNFFYLALKHLHATFRWFLLGILLLTIILSILYTIRKRGLTAKGLLAARLTVIAAHLQLLTGILVYLVSPKVIFSAISMRSPFLRFYLVEHLSVMVISVTLITIGYIRAKRNPNFVNASRTLCWFFIVALTLILAAIPWPFFSFAGSWF